VSVHEAKLKSKAQAIVAAISEDLGFEHFLLNLKSISTETFVEFLE
jgi:2C-methyl-D-erythritol 2,4-cyclodiphosphate synthase